ncbi:hypothetical protein LZ32DRAFT_639202 [Colletotrichum eremochloae]|nr:hypothetical protein LZ32DRAFT_639202 [Colletotrichum eremochloae]
MSSSFFSSMDAETRQLFLTLQQEDLEDIRTGDTDRKNPRMPSDSQVAFRLYESELRSLSTSFSEHTSAIRQSQRSLNGTHSPVNQGSGVMPALSNKRKLQEADEVMPSIETIIDLTTLVSPSPEASPEPDLSSSDGDFHEEKNACVACLTDMDEEETFHAPCGHDYCHDCIGELFEACLTSEFQFPPKCCGEPMPIDTDHDAIPAELMKKVKDKAIELSTPNRTYCRQLTCSTFIPKENIKDDVATCAEHEDYACKEDEATQELLKLAGENLWQRCPTCRALVERQDGCPHMTNLAISLPLHSSILLSMRRSMDKIPRLFLMRGMKSDALLKRITKMKSMICMTA